jgi:hypothetical protein
MPDKLSLYVKRLGILLVMITLITATEGCIFGPSTQYIEIRTWYDLNNIRNDSSGDYILMNDLDSTTDGYNELAGPTANEGRGWHPLNGPGLEGDNPPFTGTLNGQGYEIRDLFIDLPATGYVGLFSVVGEDGRIENIGVVNADVNSSAYIGALVGVNGGIVSYSFAIGSVTGDDNYIGGLVGSNVGTVSYSFATGSVTGNSLVGGLVGQNDGTVDNSYSTGSITGDSAAGGLMGGNTGNANNCYATGNVTSNSGAGGLIAANSGSVSNTYSTGSVTGSDYLGGLIGYSEGTVSYSFWDIETSGQSTSAGGTGKTTAEMQHITTFQGTGWNIIAVENADTRDLAYIWNIVNEQTYPFLSRES